MMPDGLLSRRLGLVVPAEVIALADAIEGGGHNHAKVDAYQGNAHESLRARMHRVLDKFADHRSAPWLGLTYVLGWATSCLNCRKSQDSFCDGRHKQPRLKAQHGNSIMETFANGMTLDVTVDALAPGGKAVCRHEGRVIFVDRGLPGQQLHVRLTTVRKRFAEAECLAVVAHTADECDPFCPHFGDCGGCTWQNLPYPAQLAWKERFVRDSLQRIGRIEAPNVLPTLPSPLQQGFRNKMEFAFTTDDREMLHLGLRRRGGHEVVDVTSCGLQTATTCRVVTTARDIARASGLPGWDDAAHRGFWRFLVVREPARGGQCLVQCITAPHPEAEHVVRAFFTALRQAVPEVTGCVHSIRSQNSQVAYGDATVFTEGEIVLTEKLGAIELDFGHDTFLQTNTRATELLYGEVERMAGLSGREHVWDLYCGVGSIALWLAEHAATICGMEATPASVEAAQRNAQAAGCTHCDFVAGDVRALLRSRSKGKAQEPIPDVVVTDPPRAGMHPDVIDALLQTAPARIVYVSCDPATMARDVGLLMQRYTLHEARPVDLFPHTPHVETVVLLSNKEVDDTISTTL